MSKVRLLKVLVQPVIVLDDGDTLTEIPQPAAEVKPADLDKIPDELRTALADLQAQIDAQSKAES